MGIDPGSHACGYGIVSSGGSGASSDFKYIVSGRITIPQGKPLHERLRKLYEGLTDIIGKYRPDEAVVEKIFFAKGAKSALSLGHARGVALLAASTGDLDVHEYSALEVKKAVTGYGRAEKSQVQEMIKAILGIREKISTDAADALALALCHVYRSGFEDAVSSAISRQGRAR